MSDQIKKHEVDRLLNVTVVLGWELKEEKYDFTGVTVVLRRDLSPGLLAAESKLSPSSPGK
jgi:hypothetical protein